MTNRLTSRFLVGRVASLSLAGALALGLAACGGGGGSDPDDGGTPPPSGSAQGSLLYASSNKAVRFDIAARTETSVSLATESNDQLGLAGSLATDVEEVTHVTALPNEYTINLRRVNASGFESLGALPVISATGLRVSGPVQPSPDGTRFALHTRESTLDDPEDTDHVYVIDRNGQTLLHAADYRDPVWTGNNSVVVAGADGLFELTVGASTARRIGSQGLGRPGSQPKQPAVSADGRSIAFVQGDAVWRIGVDGAGLAQLTQQRFEQGWPAWSADASKLVVLRGSCPVLGTTEPPPDVVIISATSPNQDINAASAVMRTDSVPLRTCGPVYWLP
ncbi:MAG: hypothetical protein AB1430_07520 [Pseudomonadota bacterium]